eukprot:GHVU01158733.1.p2 GENE.GHVU01158733.1~~GHVU01158733.1.p2  ORF type:complete len:103 (-),score=2.70 GHVU01158733.1:602-910(-)
MCLRRRSFFLSRGAGLRAPLATRRDCDAATREPHAPKPPSLEPGKKRPTYRMTKSNPNTTSQSTYGRYERHLLAYELAYYIGVVLRKVVESVPELLGILRNC